MPNIQTLEAISQKRLRNKQLTEIILASIAIAGVLSVGMVAPNAIRMFELLGIRKGRRQNEIIQTARKRLTKQGYLKYERNGFLRLTEKGEQALRRFKLNGYKIKKPKRWDKRWRILMFDIPEYRKGLRDKVRRTLRAIGFVRLQQSVWIYPYNCEEFMQLLKAEFRIGKDLLYLIVDTVENDGWIRECFDLNK